jgi:hypothetical protein
LQIGDRRIEGHIQEKEEARKTYEKAKTERPQGVALVEQQRPNLFTNSVAHIGPNELDAHHDRVPADARSTRTASTACAFRSP